MAFLEQSHDTTMADALIPKGGLTDNHVRDGLDLKMPWGDMITIVGATVEEDSENSTVVIDLLGEREKIGINVVKRLPGVTLVEAHPVQERGWNGENRTVYKFANKADAATVRKAQTAAIMTASSQHDAIADLVRMQRECYPVKGSLEDQKWIDKSEQVEFENIHGPRTGLLLTRVVEIPDAVLAREAAYLLEHPIEDEAVYHLGDSQGLVDL